MTHIHYRFNNFSIFCFCPFKSFCFSYRLLRSLHSSFIRFNCARTPSRQSGSIFLYPPVRLRIVLLFSFICSERHTQSIRFCTSLGTYGHLYPDSNLEVANKLTGVLTYTPASHSIADYTSNHHTAIYHTRKQPQKTNTAAV